LLDPKVNQILLLKLRTEIIIPLNDLVEWDRYGIRNNENGFIFGWIKREDGHRDFVSVNFQLTWNQFVFNYTTSSKKYSKEIAKILSKEGANSVLDPYLECEPASDIPEANLVDWQKEFTALASIFVIGILMMRLIVALTTGGTNMLAGVTGQWIPEHPLPKMTIFADSDQENVGAMDAVSTDKKDSGGMANPVSFSSDSSYGKQSQMMVLLAKA
jgi:hypothetical protein